jgi:hypothetical protein
VHIHERVFWPNDTAVDLTLSAVITAAPATSELEPLLLLLRSLDGHAAVGCAGPFAPAAAGACAACMQQIGRGPIPELMQGLPLLTIQ